MTSHVEDRIVRTVEIAAPVARVWQALTDYRQFGEWFRVDLDQPFTPGAVSTGKMTYPGYEGYPWRAIVERIEPEALFSMRWPHGGDAEDAAEPMTLVEFRLEPNGAGTRLTVTESGFASLPPDKRVEAFRSNSRGWDIQTRNIADYVEK